MAVPARRVCVLAFRLPTASATAEALKANWNGSDERSAVTVEMLHEAVRVLRIMAGDKQAQKIKPLEVPRPWTERRRPTNDPAQIRQFFNT